MWSFLLTLKYLTSNACDRNGFSYHGIETCLIQGDYVKLQLRVETSCCVGNMDKINCWTVI